jgi:hypothetical protein
MLLLLGAAFGSGCGTSDPPQPETRSTADSLLDRYTTVRLDADLGALDDARRGVIRLLVEAAHEMDSIYWRQAYGEAEPLLAAISDPGLRRYAQINYGPWDRLADNEPFIAGVGPKPRGANFYPADMSVEEFEAAAEENPALESLYTMVRRDATGGLVAIPYRAYFEVPVLRAAEKVRQAAQLAEEPGLKRYLELRADALETDEYRASDMAWMDMKDNVIDVVIGPIETYEDQLFGYKAAHEAFVLVKDLEWSGRLARYTRLLPSLQRGLPVAEQYKQESPGTESDLGAYDAIYYAGDANAGAKTIAINLPNDADVQLQKGTRRLQLKNAMRAKFDEILVPIAGVLIAEDQQANVTFDAFFGNTMFHEVAHGLGIKNTVSGRGTVREALRDHASALEEGKADILGLYMVTTLQEEGELDASLADHYVTFLAGIFRSVRFGAASAHGRANMVRFNYFKERGAFSRTEEGVYRVDPDAMRAAVDALSETILVLQGEGEYAAVDSFAARYGAVDPQLAADLLRVNEANIPVDIVFEQGVSVLQNAGS